MRQYTLMDTGRQWVQRMLALAEKEPEEVDQDLTEEQVLAHNKQLVTQFCEE